MPQLAVEGEELVVKLTPWLKFWAFHKDLRVPLSSVRSVEVPSNPWSTLRGWRSAGTGVRGYAALGSRRHGGGYDFVAILRQERAVQVDLSTGRYERLLVSVDDPERTASEVAAAAGIRR